MANVKDFYRDIGRLQGICSGGQLLHSVGQFIRGEAVLIAPKDTGYLKGSILYSITNEPDVMTAHIGTNVEYAELVEFGTGPKGAAHHDGTSPDYHKPYHPTPWWVHSSMLDPDTAKKWNNGVEVPPEGRFFYTTGQAARPFLYPALKNNEQIVVKMIDDQIKKTIGGK